jgi:hypothetical protein
MDPTCLQAPGAVCLFRDIRQARWAADLQSSAREKELQVRCQCVRECECEMEYVRACVRTHVRVCMVECVGEFMCVFVNANARK